MSRSLPRFRRHEERAADITRITRIILETGPVETPTTVQRATLAGDSRRLRGIPAVARGVAGCSPGTDPFSQAARNA